MAKKAKYLVVVESPGKTKTISKILKDEYQVIASKGHIRDLPKSPLSVDLETFETTNIDKPDRKDIIRDIKEAAKGKDKIFICSDADAEGEFIGASIAEILSEYKNKLVRATFNEITPKAVLDAIANPGKINDKLVSAQQARRATDRIVGYKVSKVLWDKVKMGISAGRVQSVAVRIISEREKEIQAFKSDEYWSIFGNFDPKIQAKLRLLDNIKVVASAEDVEKFKAGEKLVLLDSKAEDLAKSLSKRKYTISNIEEKETFSKPFPPFSTSSLQITSANRLGFDAKRTMSIAQRLYEGVETNKGQQGLITYMRTDSLAVSKDASVEAQNYIIANFGKEFYPKTANYYKSKNNSQGAHECIRPSHLELTPSDAQQYLEPDQYRLYKLIWERFISSQMTPAIYDSTTIDIKTADSGQPDNRSAEFRATGRKMKFEGYTKAYKDDEDNSLQLPRVILNQEINISSCSAEKHETQPPPRFNDASLVKTLESEGIGRPSTYGSIIDTIQNRKYVEKLGKGGKASFKMTDLGTVVTDSLILGFPTIMDLGFTRDMEQHLDDIEDGTKTYLAVMQEFYGPFSQELIEAQTRMPTVKGGVLTDTPCPKCKTPMKKLLGSLGMFLKCDKCEHTQDLDGRQKLVPVSTGLKCDKCQGNMLKMTGRFGDYLACENYKPSKKPKKGKGKKDKKTNEKIDNPTHDGQSCTFTMSIDKHGRPKRKLTPIPTDVACEKCGKQMLIRIASRKKIPAPFLACSGFPKCRHATELTDCLQKQGQQQMAIWRINLKKDAEDAKIMESIEE